MGIIRFAIENPVKVAVGVILVVLFGLLSLFRIPIQLTPDVDRPVITVETFWRGASPQEVENEIVDRQEDKLKSVTNLKKMTSSAGQNRASIRLEFPVGVDRNIAYRDVSDKLRQVTGYPEEVDEPVISATDSGMEKTIAWLILYGAEGQDVAPLKTFIEDKVKPLLERAEGIAEVPVFGGLDREVQIVVDPYRLAARQLSFADVERALRAQNKNISAGTITRGKRDYTFRTIGEYRTLSEVEDTVIAYRGGGPVFIRDVAEVVDGFAKRYAFVRSKGRRVIAMPARRETGANVIKAMDNLRRQIALVNREVLAPRGLGLELTQVYDETKYITSAIDLVTKNMLFGGLLAIAVLVVFLRSGSATGIVAVAIPISVIGSLLVISLLGRSFNVVMLAGMAFAVGMVVDNAIVVLENIYRHRSMGKSKMQAALDGAHEVWGAVLASTLTTMAVFLPVIFIEEEAGQLFRDIAIAITSAVAFSLVVAVVVIPPLSAKFFHASKALQSGGGKPWRFAVFVSSLVATVNRSVAVRLAVVVGFSGLAVLGSLKLMPATEYLPAGNQNLVFGFFHSPPGYSIDEFQRMALVVEEGAPDDPSDGIRRFWETPLGSEAASQLPEVTIPVGRNQDIMRTVVPPPIENFFYVSFGGSAFMGCTSKEPTNVKPLEFVMKRAGDRVPGVFAFFEQMSLFRSGRGGGNSVDVEIRGDDLDEVVTSASTIMRKVMEAGYDYPSPSPANFALGRPELQIIPKRAQAADLGVTVRAVGFIAEACINGAFVGEFNDKGDKIDMRIKVAGADTAGLRELAQIPLYTPSGHIVPISSIVDIRRTTAPQQIDHIEEMDSVTLSVKSKTGVPLQTTMQDLDELIAALRETGALPSSIITTLAGTADKLTQTQRSLLGDFRGVVSRPRLFGCSVTASMAMLAGIGLMIAASAAPIFGRRIAVRAGFGLLAVLILGFCALNPALVGAVFESRMILALVVTYLLMAALFESFAYPFVIMFSVPLAAVGGFAALRIVHEVSLYDITTPIQQLDVLTMLGFVILIGIVVNNAILLVHQSLNFMREQGLAPHAAVVQSVQTRTRPIFMSALTSVFGMFPLVVMTGAGSELYRGLGSVVLGGLLVSTVFTLIVIPACFTLLLDFQRWLAAARERAEESELEPAVAACPSRTRERVEIE